MRSILLRNYGGETAAQVAESPLPVAGPGQVLVRVRAAGINALDWKVREGYVRDAFPKRRIQGHDVQAVPRNVEEFHEVLGSGD